MYSLLEKWYLYCFVFLDLYRSFSLLFICHIFMLLTRCWRAEYSVCNQKYILCFCRHHDDKLCVTQVAVLLFNFYAWKWWSTVPLCDSWLFIVSWASKAYIVKLHLFLCLVLICIYVLQLFWCIFFSDRKSLIYDTYVHALIFPKL